MVKKLHLEFPNYSQVYDKQTADNYRFKAKESLQHKKSKKGSELSPSKIKTKASASFSKKLLNNPEVESKIKIIKKMYDL